MENSSSGSRQSRDAGFQRSQRRPDTNATESDTRLKETFEQAIANRFGEEIGVDLHDVAWKSIPKRYKKLAGIVGAAKLALHGAGNLFSDSVEITGRIKNWMNDLRDNRLEPALTDRKTHLSLDRMFLTLAQLQRLEKDSTPDAEQLRLRLTSLLAQDSGIAGHTGPHQSLDVKLILTQVIVELYDILQHGISEQQTGIPSRLATAISNTPEIKAIRHEYVSLLKTPASLRWIHANVLESMAVNNANSSLSHYQNALMHWLAERCKITLEHSLAHSDSKTLIQCLGLVSFATHGAHELRGIIESPNQSTVPP